MKTPAGPQEVVATREMPSLTAADTAQATPAAPPAASLVTPSGDACPNCSSPMAGDQRYCIECGERRGESRLSTLEQAAATQPNAAPAQTPGVTPPPPSKGRSQGLALLATIALLLLAMGVGVLIGNDGNSKANTAQQPIVIGGAGATTATAGATDATAAAATAANKGSEDTAASSDKSGSNADALAKKNGVKLAPKDAKIGDKCDGKAVGCEDGQFTGDYFGQ